MNPQVEETLESSGLRFLNTWVAALVGVSLSVFAWWQLRENQFYFLTQEVAHISRSLPAYTSQPAVQKFSSQATSLLFDLQNAIQLGGDIDEVLEKTGRSSPLRGSQSLSLSIEYYDLTETGAPILKYRAPIGTQRLVAEPNSNNNDLALHVLERVRNSGSTGCFGMFPLFAETVNIRCFLAVYDDNRAIMTTRERKETTKGIVAIAASLTPEAYGGVMPTVISGVDIGFYGDDGSLGLPQMKQDMLADQQHGALSQNLHDFNGLPVRFIVRATDELVERHRSNYHWFALVVGLLITGTLISLTLRMQARSDRIFDLVQRRTQQLKARSDALVRANQQLIQENFEREKAEAALFTSERRYRLIADNLTDVIYTHSMSLKWTYVTPSIEKLVGMNVQQFLHLPVTDFMTNDSFSSYLKALEHLRKHPDKNQVMEIETLGADGSKIVEVKLSLALDNTGRPTEVLGVCRDITARKQIEQEKEALELKFQHSQRMESIGRLAGGVAHDFNNLLTAILGYAHLIDAVEALPPMVKHGVGVIKKAGTRAEQLTQQLLGFAREGKYQNVPVDMNEQIKETVGFLQHTLNKNIEFNLELNDGPVVSEGDPAQLSQVLLNLAVNARDAMPDGGTLTFKTWIQESDTGLQLVPESPGYPCVAVSVTDTGVGIPSENLENIFEPFYTNKEEGTGMGLAMVYGVMVSHGGAIHVQSQPGQGSVFTLYLPLSADDSRMEALPMVEAADNTSTLEHSSARILVVDDEEFVRDVVTDMLDSVGYDVVSCDSGNAALSLLEDEREQFDVILVDMIMPGMNGWEFTQDMRKKRPRQPVILCTGYSKQQMADLISLNEYTGFLSKPYEEHDLMLTVEEMLKSPQRV